MQISLKWINELVEIENVDLNLLIEKLTLGGFEVEEILEIEVNNQKEIALDISATANRSDSLSIQGISKEISALLNKPLKISKYSSNDFHWIEQINKHSELKLSTNECLSFITFTIENVKDITIPNWLQNKLISSGITPVNNLLDFQTYVLLETGYPLEFYDLTKISSQLNCTDFDLRIESSQTDLSFTTNNNSTYKLDSSISLVKANELPISIAGISPSNEVAYTNETTALLMEGSIFNAAAIRRKSRKLGLRTDRSARYEKSIKDVALIKACYRLISLLRISNPQLICKLHTVYQMSRPELKPIQLKYETIKEILGPVKTSTQQSFDYISLKAIPNYLDRLGFSYTYDSLEQKWDVQIPYERSEDITREIDLIEEIGRLHGFNEFLTRLPKIKIIGTEDSTYQTRKKITSCFLNLGLHELIHYSLVKERTFVQNNIKLVNPLVEDYATLRSALLPSLLHTAQENLKQGNDPMEGFEFGHVFLGDKLTNLEEKEHVAGLFGGIRNKSTWSEQPIELSWFEAKGKIEQFFNQLNITTIWKKYSSSANNEVLHPYRTAKIYLENEIYLGIFGQIHPLVAKKLSLSSNIYLFEFDLDSIQTTVTRNPLIIYKPYSSYPKIVKDLSFIINQDISFDDIQKIVYANGTKFLSDVTLLDEYKGSSIPEEHVSLCLQLTFQSTQKTLENKEIESIISNLQDLLTNKFNAELRN